jgi:hypothetical protein
LLKAIKILLLMWQKRRLQLNKDLLGERWQQRRRYALEGGREEEGWPESEA